MKATKLRWWVLVNSIAAGLGIAVYKGAAAFMWHADASKLSFATWILFFVLTGFTGYLTMVDGTPGRDAAQDKRYVEGLWYASEFLMTLGLTGTVLGIILIFTGSAGLDPGNTALLRTALLSMSTGLTTAFVTTLSGVASSALLKIQLVSYSVEKSDAPGDDA
jgi:hypothetical protein